MNDKWTSGDPDFEDFEWLNKAAVALAELYECDKIYFEFQENMIIIHKMYIGRDGKPNREGQPTSYMIAGLMAVAKFGADRCILYE